jgi:hypothetical protein
MKRASKLLFPALGILLLWFAPVGHAQSIAPGTEVRVSLLDRLDTGKTDAGETFSATLAEPVRFRGRLVWAKGTTVTGRVVEVVSSGRLKRPASLTLEVTAVGKSSIHTEAIQIDGKSHAARNLGLIGGGTAAGAILGGIAGGGKGTVVGSMVGAGAGTATAYATGKQEIVLAPETQLLFIVAGKAPEARMTPEVRQEPEPREMPMASRSNLRRDQDSDHVEDRDDAYDSLIFSDHDQNVIRAYFRYNRENLPPGLAKRNDNLPPGLERQLRRDGTLPSGLQKHVEPFPEELTGRLPRLPKGYSRATLSGRAMIMSDDGQIVDLIYLQ